MPVDFDMVLRSAMDAFAYPALFTPLVSQPGAGPIVIRGVFSLKPADIMEDTSATIRADDYTFGVRASEFPILASEGDLVSNIIHPSFQRFLDGRVFKIWDTGDDGMGDQQWILKEQRDVDNDP